MAAESDRESRHRSQIDARRERSEERERSEAFGPVALTRYVKDDGRALILYTLRQDDETTESRPV